MYLSRSSTLQVQPFFPCEKHLQFQELLLTTCHQPIVTMSSYTRSQDKSHPVGSNYNDNLISQSWRVPAISVGTSIDSLVYNTRRFAKSPIPNVTLTPSQRIVAPPKPTNSNPPSVKHLTCYFWDKNKNCKWSDQECLYAHHATGKVASGPMQVEPGRELAHLLILA